VAGVRRLPSSQNRSSVPDSGAALLAAEGIRCLPQEVLLK
jgi:hypothetical protein